MRTSSIRQPDAFAMRYNVRVSVSTHSGHYRKKNVFVIVIIVIQRTKIILNWTILNSPRVLFTIKTKQKLTNDGLHVVSQIQSL